MQRMAINESTATNANSEAQMFRALLDVEHHGCPNSDVTAEFPDVHIESVSGARTEASCKKQLLKVETDTTPVNEFAAVYRDHELVREMTVHPHRDTNRVAHFSTAIDYTELASVSGVLSRHGAYRGYGATAAQGSEQWWLFFESHDVLGDVTAELETQGSNVDVLRKEEISLRAHHAPQSPLMDLTPRQREVFFVAMEHDYFALDSDTTLEELAEALDLSTSSVWEHLSRAKEKIFLSITDDVGDV